ncbi:hypothetical protein Rsub_03702 [Raphidocelis subcapitata]|uniref:Tyrosine-protein kinase ephrin type A/B receptor-like domain-containing protein n=1 Tax=Raphidocelis subcapitata TaxID=307507 RepID=A0A2V0NT40_9CHLO|nr:hypothetical protein Rsub_03702 [Raphidocelis subcapitata]|eukprot:GBF90848.1 hypothetical protein Rsub_03702 [Raphidocelis subcapitata]
MKQRARVGAVVLGLLLAGVARASIPDCPDDEPFGVCPAGNPCAARNACGGGKWCVRECGCRFKCLDGDTVTIATTTDGAAPAAQGAEAAAGAPLPENAETPGDAAAALDLPQLLQGPGGGGGAGPRFKPLGPLTLPARLQPPNLTELAAGVHKSLAAAVAASLRSAAAAGPGKCADGRDRVRCDIHACDASPCGEAQVCVPRCGSCSEHKCVDLALPLKAPKLPQLPALPLPKMPKLSLPKPPCANGQAINLTATVRTIPAALLSGGPDRHSVSISCADCPEGSVSKQPALSCTLCLPGTYADRSLWLCRKCGRGYYSARFGATQCQPCPADTFAPLPGAFACIPCPPGFTTRGTKAQSTCAFTGAQ